MTEGDVSQCSSEDAYEIGVWLALRDAHVVAILAMETRLRDARLTAVERDLWLRIRQARLIELGAVEEFLRMPRTVTPRRKRATGGNARAGSRFLHHA